MSKRKNVCEEWKHIKGYEGYYQISNHGNVRSVDREITQKSKWGCKMKRIIKGKQLTPTDNGRGYLIVFLLRNGKRKNHYVHRLVAEHFVRPFKKGEVVNHLDYDQRNNTSSNLEVVTQKENIMHSVKNMSKPRKATFNNDTYIIKRTTKRGQIRYEVNVKNKYLGKYPTIEKARSVRNEAMRNDAEYFKQLGELYEKYIAE